MAFIIIINFTVCSLKADLYRNSVLSNINFIDLTVQENVQENRI